MVLIPYKKAVRAGDLFISLFYYFKINFAFSTIFLAVKRNFLNSLEMGAAHIFGDNKNSYICYKSGSFKRYALKYV